MALLRQYERDLFLVLKAMEEEEAEDVDRYCMSCIENLSSRFPSRSDTKCAVQP